MPHGRAEKASILPKRLTGRLKKASILPKHLTGRLKKASILPKRLTEGPKKASILPKPFTEGPKKAFIPTEHPKEEHIDNAITPQLLIRPRTVPWKCLKPDCWMVARKSNNH